MTDKQAYEVRGERVISEITGTRIVLVFSVVSLGVHTVHQELAFLRILAPFSVLLPLLPSKCLPSLTSRFRAQRKAASRSRLLQQESWDSDY